MKEKLKYLIIEEAVCISAAAIGYYIIRSEYPDVGFIARLLVLFGVLRTVHFCFDIIKNRKFGTRIIDRMTRCEKRKQPGGIDPCAICKQGYACAKGMEAKT